MKNNYRKLLSITLFILSASMAFAKQNANFKQLIVDDILLINELYRHQVVANPPEDTSHIKIINIQEKYSTTTGWHFYKITADLSYFSFGALFTDRSKFQYIIASKLNQTYLLDGFYYSEILLWYYENVGLMTKKALSEYIYSVGFWDKDKAKKLAEMIKEKTMEQKKGKVILKSNILSFQRGSQMKTYISPCVILDPYLSLLSLR